MVVIIVQSGIKLYDFTILAAGVETEQRNGAIMCVFDRTEGRSNLNLKR